MRMFLVGVLSGTLIGCSCPTAPQAQLEVCTSKDCLSRTAAGPPIELKPTPFKPNHATTKVESKNATKTAKTPFVVATAAKPNSPQTSDGSDKDKIASPITMTPVASTPPQQRLENAKSIVGTNVNAAISGPASESSDPVLEKAKVTVASKMEDPASVEFEDMTRAIRKSSLGQLDTICGHVRGKKRTGEQTGKRAFLYLVKEDVAVVDYGSVPASAYRAICTSGP
jgi:hypothetical protein